MRLLLHPHSVAGFVMASGPYSHLNPATFFFESCTSTTATTEETASRVLPNLLSIPPQWIDPTWPIRLSVGVAQTPRSKARTMTNRPTNNDRIVSGVRKIRQGEVTGIELALVPSQTDPTKDLLGGVVGIDQAKIDMSS